MKLLNRRINNWKQAMGVAMLCNAAGFAVGCAVSPSLQLAGYGCFSLWLGLRLWMVGSEPTPAPPSAK